ncbi:hypothetical protein [Microbulbifer sp. GL-2]|nr:hypothetical protein [Microbulbifer sp. GL-2]BBM04089.1 hypothetical protein GL2_41630 [Microbulbifer sp. GL-2]
MITIKIGSGPPGEEAILYEYNAADHKSFVNAGLLALQEVENPSHYNAHL